jgi:hypothetical protein
MNAKIESALHLPAPASNDLLFCIAGSTTGSAVDLEFPANFTGWVRFDAYGADFGVSTWSGTATAGARGGRPLAAPVLNSVTVPTANNPDDRPGFIVPDGSPRDYYIDSQNRKFRVVASAAAGTLRITKAS